MTVDSPSDLHSDPRAIQTVLVPSSAPSAMTPTLMNEPVDLADRLLWPERRLRAYLQKSDQELAQERLIERANRGELNDQERERLRQLVRIRLMIRKELAERSLKEAI